MMDDLLIINDSGALLYNWHGINAKEDTRDDLLSGFLTAIDNFATIERGEDIKSLKLKETTIIFEKSDKTLQKLNFVITTKREDLRELLHALVHDIMDRFTELYYEELNKEFDGEITKYKKFNEYVAEAISSYGLDLLNEAIETIDEDNPLKSITYLDTNDGKIFYIHAKQYLNKEKVSYLVSLLSNSARLLVQDALRKNFSRIELKTVKNEILSIEPKEKLTIIKQFQYLPIIETLSLSLKKITEKGKFVKKLKKLDENLHELNSLDKIFHIFIVDLMGTILYSRIDDELVNFSSYMPEMISLVTSSKKVCEGIYSRELFSSVVKVNGLCFAFLNLIKYLLVLVIEDDETVNTVSIERAALDIVDLIKSL
jgi:hypothetical protein